MIQYIKFLTFIFILISTVNLNAQYAQKKLKKFVKTANENIELIHQNRKQVENNSEYEFNGLKVISPFMDYDFEVVEPFAIDEKGDVSMRIKYFRPDDPFIYSVKGSIKDLERVVVDIYFILEFKYDSLQVEYENLSSGNIEVYHDSMLHLGFDQTGLVSNAENVGFPAGVY